MSVTPAADTSGDQAERSPGPPSGTDPVQPAGRPYAWLAASVVAALLVVWGSGVSLDRSGVLRALAVTMMFAGLCVLTVTPGVALLSVVARRRRLGPATGLGLLFAGAGSAAMVAFWAWFVSPRLGRAAVAALLVASLVAIGVFGRRGELSRLGLSMPLALTAAVGLLYTGLAFVQGGITGTPARAIDYRYWLAADNEIPMQFATRIAEHLPLSGFLVGNWLSSDRPPLQTGFALLLWPLWHAGGRQLGYQLLATGLEACWLPALWVLLRVRGVPAGRVCAAVLATAATGAVFFNTVYVWPKMLAGGLALAAFAIIVSRDDDDRQAGAGVLAVALAVLSMLSHGGTAFALIAFIPFVYQLRRRITIRSAVASAAAALALYLPWVLYQRFVNPPGDRLLKWQLAGVIPIVKTSAVRTIVDQYRSLSLHRLLANKWANVYTLVANPAMWHSQHSDTAWIGGFLGYARIAQLYSVLPATGPLLIGAAALLVPSARRALADLKPLVVFTLLAFAVWVVLLWGGGVPTIIHQGAYASIVLFVGLCAVAVTALPRLLAGGILTCGLAWFIVSWVPGFGFGPADPRDAANRPLDGAMILVCVVALVAVAALCYAHLGAGGRVAGPRQLSSASARQLGTLCSKIVVSGPAEAWRQPRRGCAGVAWRGAGRAPQRGPPRRWRGPPARCPAWTPARRPGRLPRWPPG